MILAMDAWRILHGGGLPLAGRRVDDAPSEPELARATLAVLDAGMPDERHADALAAFLRAWQHHFPASFERAFAEEARRVESWADAHVVDRNRYVKLRRIAIENLSRVL
jgi:hypothetical protein